MKEQINVFGENVYIQRLENYFEIKNIITSSNLKTLRSEVDTSLPLVVVSSGKLQTAILKAKEICQNVIHITELMAKNREQFGDLEFNYNANEFLIENDFRVKLIADRFTDIESKNAFESIIKFRETYNLSLLSDFKDRQDTQYFEDFLPKHFKGDFLDVGVFDAYTSMCFRKLYGADNTILMFEPDSNNNHIFRDVYANIANSTVIQKGLSNKFATLAFDSKGSASVISEVGSETISVIPLDSMKNLNPGFIKMDIEGGELNALFGAANYIKEKRPILAIACYHSPQQMLEIPEFLMENTSNYNYYFRHYTESIYESVFYAVPK